MILASRSLGFLRAQQASHVGQKRFAVLLVVSVLAVMLPFQPQRAAAADGTFRLISLGDSYTAGNGAGTDQNEERERYYDFRESDDPTRSECMRNHNAYPLVYARRLRSEGRTVLAHHRACSGAVTDTVLETQIPALTNEQKSDADLVILSIGGNDAQFSSIARDCLVRGSSDPCSAKLAAAEQTNDSIIFQTSRILDEILGFNPTVRVVLVGYPRLTDPYCKIVPRAQEDTIRALQSTLDTRQKIIADERQRVEFMPLASEFSGKGPCDGNSTRFVHHLVAGGPDVGDTFFESFHPNRRGHQAMADSLHRLGLHDRPIILIPGPEEPLPLVPIENPGQPSSKNSLRTGEGLTRGQRLEDADGRGFRAEMQLDGNFVLYDCKSRPIWASNTDLSDMRSIRLQADGRIVGMNQYGVERWRTPAQSRRSNLRLVMQGDGNLVLYSGTNALWSSNTWKAGPSCPKPVTVLPPPATDTAPVGVVDSIRGVSEAVVVRGWAYDPDVPTSELKVDVYIGGSSSVPGAERHRITANMSRPDVAAKHTVAGPKHGFDVSVPTLKRGRQTVCVYAIGNQRGGSSLLGCSTVSVASNPPITPGLPICGISTSPKKFAFFKVEWAATSTGNVRYELQHSAADPDRWLKIDDGTTHFLGYAASNLRVRVRAVGQGGTSSPSAWSAPCPRADDSDNDGLPDLVDACPRVAGEQSGDGCPSPNVPMCGGLLATIIGTPGDDVLEGTPGRDVIVGLQGDDRIDGLAGDDVICGGKGDDWLVGGQGFDVIYGAQGNDYLMAADGIESGRADSKGSRMFGGTGDDRIFGSNRWDRMQGGPGEDILNGYEGRDWIRGGAHSDTLHGGKGIDDLHGGRGNDTIFVIGADQIRGGAGSRDRCLAVGGTSRVPANARSCERRS